MTHHQLRRAFPATTLAAIEHEIKLSEAKHIGEIRFAVEAAWSGPALYHDQSVREHAIDVFSHLRMWDTDFRNGILIYLSMADRCVEIVADRGIHVKAGAHEWEKICRCMEASFSQQQFETGVIEGIRSLTQVLTHHFPGKMSKHNELSDKVVVL